MTGFERPIRKIKENKSKAKAKKNTKYQCFISNIRAKQEQRVFLCLALFFVTFVTRLLPVNGNVTYLYGG